MVYLYAFVAGLFGILFGSAINAFVWRLHKRRSWVHGRSECSDCGHPLAPQDLIPVVSWLMLGGRCRYCRKRIQDSPLVELVTAGVFALSAYVLPPVDAPSSVRLGFWLALVILMMVLAVYDLRWYLLPNRVMYPFIVLAGIYTLTMAWLTGVPQVLLGGVVAAVLAGGGFFLLVFLSKGRAMGGGDIKLAFAMGLMLGAKGTIVALLLAFNAAAVLGIALIVLRRRGRRDHIAFGPFLVAGTMTAFLYGQQIVHWYLTKNGLS